MTSKRTLPVARVGSLVALGPLVLSFLVLWASATSAQPVNDDCGGAIPAVLGLNAVDITPATDSIVPADDSACTGTLLGGLHHDLWWSWTAPSSGLLTVSLCGTGGFDSDLAIYEGSCASLTLLACNGDTTGCASFTSEVRDLPVVAGDSLLIRIGGWQPTSLGAGQFSVELTTAVAPQDLVCGVIGSELAVSWSAPLPVVGWTIEVDGTNFADLPPGELSWQGGVAPGIGTTTEVCVVADYGASTVDACCTVAGAPGNDACVNATLVTVGTVAFDTTSATDGTEPFDPSPCAASLPGDLVQDLWYVFVAPDTGSIDVSTCGTASFDTSLVVYRGSCGALIQLGCNGDTSGCAGYTSLVAGVSVSGGETLYLRVGGWQTGSTGTGILDVVFHPTLVTGVSTTSTPGSGDVVVTATAAADLTSAQVTVDGIPYWQSVAPIATGGLIDATATGFPWPAPVEVCIEAASNTGVGAPLCASVDVTAAPVESVVGTSTTIADLATTHAFINASGSTLPADLRVRVDIDHPNIADLRVTLVNPHRSSVILHNQEPGEGNGLHTVYWQAAGAHSPPFGDALSMRPSVGSLMSLIEAAPAGEWSLVIEDLVSGNTGTLVGWTLDFFDVPPAVLPGPDLYVPDHGQMSQLGRVGDEVGLMLQSICCNQGNEPLDWHGNPNPTHPFMVFNLYRVSDERIVQVGASWAKHAPGPATTANACGFGCSVPLDPFTLGVGCSDIYSAGFNGIQSNLGPRSEINPWTGSYEYSTSVLSSPPPSYTAIERRLRITDADLDPAANPGTELVVEGLYIAHDDPHFDDNVTHEPITVSGTPGGTWSFDLSSVGENTPAIFSWSGAQFAEVRPADESDGRCWLAAKVTSLGGGLWRYQYALWNHNMARMVGAFRVPLSPGVTVTDISFEAPWIESTVYANDPWSHMIDVDSLTWSTPTSNPATNPLRWGYLYGFGFTADAPPASGIVEVEGHTLPETMTADVLTPVMPPVDFVRGDCNGSTSIDVADAVFLLQLLFASGSPASCADACDGNDDNNVDIADAVALLQWLFVDGAPPPPPHPNCGSDPTSGGPGCGASACP